MYLAILNLLPANVNPLGNTTTNTYDSRGNLISTTDALGHVSRSSYDSRNNLLSSTDALGNTSTYSYDPSGNLTSSTDALGHSTSYTYDSRGNQLSSSTTVSGQLLTSSATYDPMNNTLTSTDRRGYTSTNTYDERGKILTSTNALDQTTTYIYNDAGMQTSVIDSNSAVTETVYDNQGRAIRHIAPDGYYTETEYDIAGRVVASVDRAGARSRTVYDSVGRAFKTIAPNGATSETTFDALGRAVLSKDARGGISSREYDEAGRTKSVTDALGNTTRYEYDNLGRQTAMIDANGHRWQSEYDASGRKTATVYPDGTRSSVEFDAAGRKVAEIDQAGIRTEFLYDEAGRLAGVDDAEGGETRYTYDPGGNLLTITDPNSHTTSFTYDELGRKTSRTLPEGMTETWTYHDCCRASEHHDFNTIAAGSATPTVRFEYDEMKREVFRVYADGKALARSYNVRGQLESVVYTGYEFGLGEPYQDRTFEYDPVTGRLTRDNKEDGQWIAYKYDILGNLTETRFPGDTADHVVTYTHDPLNRLSTVTDQSGTTNYTYDKVGNRKSMAYPNQTVATYEFDSLNRLLYLENSATYGIISSYRYTLGPAGNRLAIAERYREPHDAQGNPSPVIEDLCEYQYDNLYRLTRESRTSPAPDRTYWIEYAYDPFGNRLDMNSAGLHTTYSYDQNDRLLTETSGALTTAYTWDDNGNMTGKTGPDPETSLTTAWDYSWNPDNMMSQADKNITLASSYLYDFQGNRIASITSSQTNHFLIDTNNQTGYTQALRETDASLIELVSYTFGDDLISQMRDSLSYLHYDGLGSTRSLTSLQNTITDSIIYFAFGALLFRFGITLLSSLFTGETFDANIEYYYFRARFYNPDAGIFISLDPFSGYLPDPLSFHKYIYTYNQPSNFTDFSGKWTLIELFVGLAILGALVVLGVTCALKPIFEETECTLLTDEQARRVQDTYDSAFPQFACGSSIGFWNICVGGNQDAFGGYDIHTKKLYINSDSFNKSNAFLTCVVSHEMCHITIHNECEPWQNSKACFDYFVEHPDECNEQCQIEMQHGLELYAEHNTCSP